MLKLAAKVAPLLVLAACASLSEDQCRTGDWATIGYNDGANGRLQSYISNHSEACAEFGIRPDLTAWLHGRAEGLKQYCTRDNAYRVGRQGNELSPVCETDTDALKLANFFGLRYFEITAQINKAQEEIDKLMGMLARDNGTLSQETRTYYLTRINDLQEQIINLTELRAKFLAPPA